MHFFDILVQCIEGILKQIVDIVYLQPRARSLLVSFALRRDCDICVLCNPNDHIAAIFEYPTKQRHEWQFQPVGSVPVLLYKQSYHADVACHGKDTNGDGSLFADVDLAIGKVVYQGEGLYDISRTSVSFHYANKAGSL